MMAFFSLSETSQGRGERIMGINNGIYDIDCIHIAAQEWC